MPRFVILHHELPASHARASHWDFMLERDGRLLTWALDESPVVVRKTSGRQLSDHRIAYLTKEGPISNGRGTIARVDEGTFRWLAMDDRSASVYVEGQIVQGYVHMTRDGAVWNWRIEPPAGTSNRPIARHLPPRSD